MRCPGCLIGLDCAPTPEYGRGPEEIYGDIPGHTFKEAWPHLSRQGGGSVFGQTESTCQTRGQELNFLTGRMLHVEKK